MTRKSVHIWVKKVNPFRRLRLWTKQKLGWIGTPVIIPYRGYGNSMCAYVSGCVTEDKGLSKPDESHGIWQNMRSMIKRYISEEIPGVRVRAEFSGKKMITVTNKQGVFHLKFDLKGVNITDENWYPVQFELLDTVAEEQVPVRATGEILIVKDLLNRYGVISDVDDTILVSHSTNFIKKLRLMLFKNAMTRLPFEGVSAFYRALHEGTDDKSKNPVFFVSSSQWNLYDLLVDFCNFREIPKGPFLLKDMHLFKIKHLFRLRKSMGKHAHKIEKIKHILDTFNFLNFILIGDSGQKDAEIYKYITLKHPGRILAIYIRDIRKSRAKKITIISKELNNEGIDMLLIKDTVLAGKHAIEKKFIKAGAFKDIVYERAQDHFAEVEI